MTRKTTRVAARNSVEMHDSDALVAAANNHAVAGCETRCRRTSSWPACWKCLAGPAERRASNWRVAAVVAAAVRARVVASD